MNTTLQALMQDATRLTRDGRIGDALAALQQALGQPGLVPPGGTAQHASPRPPAVDAARFVTASHSHGSRTLRYKLYVPPGQGDRPLPLLVMLHGCTQNPDDFAAGTAMNDLAREQGFVVLYPAQSQQANAQGCWNWFKHNHQRRGGGEPALIAGMTQAVMARHPVDANRVFIAGLSAGGAMAALVAAAYPELYAAVGVHSGLPGGAAHDLPGALAAMRHGAAATAGGAVAALPTIVFHGDQDGTVHPRNGEQVIAAVLAAQTPGQALVERGRSAGGRAFTCTTHLDACGAAVAEHWLVHGAGHAWSGGRAAGSYTDASGPDASREMLRFFAAHPRRTSRPA